MSSEITFALIKPDAVEAGVAGEILSMMERDFYVADVVCSRWNRKQVAEFYAEHNGKPFFDSLCDFMSSGRMYAVLLVGDDAIARWRRLMGPTDPRDSVTTVRGKYGNKDGIIMRNAVHGSASRRDFVRESELVRWAISPQYDRGRMSLFGDEAVKKDRANDRDQQG